MRRQWMGGAVALVVLAGCGSGTTPASSSSQPTGPVVIGVFNPFSGPDAAFGPEMIVTCNAAAALIDAAGGINGQHLSCSSTDTHGDPADAVAAANKLIATTSNLVGVVGPSSDEALATTPIFEAAHIPMFGDTGQAAFDKTTLQYFWRVTPADDVKGNAMAIWAIKQGFKSGAAVFGNDAGAQSDIPALKTAFAKLGGSMVVNDNIALDQSSYRTEVAAMLALQPQVIFTETDPQSAATFLSNVVELNHSLLPIIGTDTSFQPPYVQAVTQAVGAAALQANYVAVQPYAPTTGAGYDTFKTAELAAPGASASDLQTFIVDPFAMSYYDSVNIMALAMVAAKSTDPATYNPFISKVTTPGSGVVQVSSYQAGKAALAQGKQIQYVGAGGLIVFNAHHNSTGAFQVGPLGTSGAITGVVTAADIAAVNK
jgi:branched-chain amino acid transport system substrate-binding protein